MKQERRKEVETVGSYVARKAVGGGYEQDFGDKGGVGALQCRTLH